MIARRWHGRVRIERSAEYLELMRRVALPDYAGTPGNRGAWCLHRVEGDIVHVEMLTFWADEAAIARFAGSDISVAKYYDFDAEFLLEMEACVLHFQMVAPTPPDV